MGYKTLEMDLIAVFKKRGIPIKKIVTDGKTYLIRVERKVKE